MLKVLVRGGGDLASGVARRLYLAGCFVVVTELEDPRCIRRSVSYGSAVHDGSASVEGVIGVRVNDIPESFPGSIAVIADAEARVVRTWQPDAVVDARMLKHTLEDSSTDQADLVVGLGPGFEAGVNCDVVVETMRGNNLGRVISTGSAQVDTGVPDTVAGYGAERVLRSPDTGTLSSKMQIGESVSAGQTIAAVDNTPVKAPFDGILRGLIRTGSLVAENEKIGDIYPGNDTAICFAVSDKASAVAEGVLEAIHTRFNGRLS